MEGFSWDVGQALTKIKNQQEELFKILGIIQEQSFDPTDPLVKIEISKYIRWRETTYNMIKEYVGNEEAEKFQKLKTESAYSANNSFDFSAMHYDWNQLFLFLQDMSKAIAESNIEISAEEVVNRRYNILHKLYELKENKQGEISITNLAQAMRMERIVVGSTLIHWAGKQGLVTGKQRGDELFVELTPAGENEIKKTIKRPNEPTKNFSPNIVYNISHSNVQIGNQNNQQINSNDNLDKAIQEIKLLINHSSLSDIDKEEVVNDVERFKELSKKEKTKEVIEKAKGRLEIIEKGLKIGSDAGSLFLKAAPYLETLNNFLHHL